VTRRFVRRVQAGPGSDKAGDAGWALRINADSPPVSIAIAGEVRLFASLPRLL
jgi:hypothetical protein